MQLRGPYDDVAPRARALAGGRAGLWGSLMFLGVGYLLILASPLLSSQLAVALRDKPDLTLAGPWLPAAAAAGVALLGASAMMLVLARLVRDVEERPYASIAPVLTVFTGFILMGLRAKLPFAGLAGEHLGVFALALSLCGGALACRDAIAVRLLGWTLALLPPAAVLFALGAFADQDPVTALRRADPQVRVYVILLALSSLALALVGAASRAFGNNERHVQTQPALRVAPEPYFGGASSYAGQPGYGGQFQPPVARRDTRAYSAADDSLVLPRGGFGRVLVVALVAVVVAGLSTYQFIVRPQRAAEAARAADVAAARALPHVTAHALEAPNVGGPIPTVSAAQPAAVIAAVTPAAVTPPVVGAAPALKPVLPVTPIVPAAPRVPEAMEPQPRQAQSAAHHTAKAPVKAPAKLATRRAAHKAPKANTAKQASLAIAQPPLANAKKAPEKPARSVLAGVLEAPAKTAKPAKAAPPVSTNSADLDIDQLVEKAMKSRGKSAREAADDPILGL